MRKRTETRWLDIFSPALIRRTLIATLVASSVLVAYWGVVSWLPAFLASPVAEGGAGLTITKSARWLIVLQVGAFLGYISFGWIADRIGRRPAFTLFMIGAAAVVPTSAGFLAEVGRQHHAPDHLVLAQDLGREVQIQPRQPLDGCWINDRHGEGVPVTAGPLYWIK